MANVQIFFKGEEAIQQGVQDDAFQAARREAMRNKLDEFYLQKGEATRLLILDDDPTAYYRHVLPNGNGGYDPFTCLTDKGNCPLCAAGKPKRYVSIYTVIDLNRVIQSKKNPGKEYRYKKYILAAGGDDRNRLLHLRKLNGGSLKLAVLSFSRGETSKKSLGESIDFVSRVNLEWIKTKLAPLVLKALPAYADQKGNAPKISDWLSPADYEKVFPFIEAEKLAAMAGVAFKGSGTSGASGGVDDLGLGDLGLGTTSTDLGLEAGFDSGIGADDDLGLGSLGGASSGIEDDLVL